MLSFTAGNATSSTIALSWDDNDGTTPADKFLIMVNTTGTFVAPVDGTESNDDTDISDGYGQVNVSHGDETYTFSELNANTTYYFKIYPYTNFGNEIDFKTDGTIPVSSASTTLTGASNHYLIITEVADPRDVWESKFVELYNAGDVTINFSSEIWYLCRQANGGSTSWGNIQLMGSVNSGETYTISYNTANFFSSYGFNSSLANGYISGNGNDGYFLYSGGDNTSGTLVDAFGVIGEDGDGKEWEYTNSKAVRKHSDTIPSQIWQSSQWIVNYSSANDEDMTPNWHRKTLQWTGSQSSAWEDQNNWTVNATTSSYKPDAGSKIIIPVTTTSPTISSEASCDYIDIETNASLTLSSGTLIIGH